MLRHARAGEPLPLFLAAPLLESGIIDLEARIENDAGTVLATIDADETVHLGLYQTEESWLPPAAGRYTLVWTSAAAPLLIIDEILVHVNPVGDLGAEQARRFQRYYGAAGLNCDLIIYDAELVQLESLDLAAVPSIVGVYRSIGSATLPAQGVYLFAWLAGGVAVAYDVVYAGVARGSRNVRVYVGETGVAVEGVQPVQAVASCDVLVSYADGTPIVQTLTDGDGLARFVLEEGIPHVVSLRKDGLLFGRNNWSLTPADPELDAAGEAANDWNLMVDVFRPSFSPRSPLGANCLSTMKVDAVDLSGVPAVGVRVLVNNLYAPFSVTVDDQVFGVLGSSVEAVTDGNGHAEIPLVRGQFVEVSVYGSGITRRFTVPDAVEFSAMSAMVGSDDPFVIANPVLPTATRFTP